MIDVEKVRAWQSGDIRHRYTARDTILYALGVGAGADPLDARQLRLTCEKDLQALPTMAAVLASPGAWMRDRAELGIDFLRLVHGEQAITLHAPLPVAGTVVGRSRVTRLVDKGEGKGAVMHVEKQLTDAVSAQRLATTEHVFFLRGDGGFSNGQGGAEPATDGAAVAPASVAAAAAPAAAVPETPPDVTVDLPTRPDAALLYRLSGDLNPLHVDPAVAARAGFKRPILHGLATYGIAARGLIERCADGDASRLQAFRARLSSPVFPGETLCLEAWMLADGEVAFRARVPAREVVVLSHGRARMQAAGSTGP